MAVSLQTTSCIYIYIYIYIYMCVCIYAYICVISILKDYHLFFITSVNSVPSMHIGYSYYSMPLTQKIVAPTWQFYTLQSVGNWFAEYLGFYSYALNIMVFGLEGGWEFWLLPWPWHILSIPLKAGRGMSANTCWLDDVFPPDDLGSGPCTP